MANFLALRIAILIVAAGIGTGSGSLWAGDKLRCYNNWSDAAPLVKEHGLVSVRELSNLVKSKKAGTVVKTTLCHDADGELVYRLVIKDRDGKLTRKTVNARKPFDR